MTKFSLSVTVKKGRTKFFNVQVNSDESPLAFKQQLFTLTGIPVERQKVVCRGTVLKDNEWEFDLSNVHIFISYPFATTFSNTKICN